MNKEYVQQYGHLESTHWWFAIRQKIILQAIKKYAPDYKHRKLTILNVGAAAGGSSRWLSVFGDVISLENDPWFLEHLSLQSIKVMEGSVTAIPLPDNSVDMVCAFDVIEHVVNDQQATHEMMRVCREGGSVCITVPAFQSLWGIHDDVNGHKRRYTKRGLQKLFDQYPVKILHTTYFNSLLFIPIFFFRKIQSVFKKKSISPQSDFAYLKKNNWLNHLPGKLFGLEVFLLKFIRFPVGVSLVMLFKKNTLPVEKPGNEA